MKLATKISERIENLLSFHPCIIKITIQASGVRGARSKPISKTAAAANWRAVGALQAIFESQWTAAKFALL